MTAGSSWRWELLPAFGVQVQDDDDTVGTGCGLCGLGLPVVVGGLPACLPTAVICFYFFSFFLFFVKGELEFEFEGVFQLKKFMK